MGCVSDIKNSTFAYNSTDSNGGAYESSGSPYTKEGSNATFVNCTFYKNSAQIEGGAINNSDDNPSLAVMSLVNTTVAGNSSQNGSGIYNRGFLTLQSSILASNSGSTSCSKAGGAVTDGGGNLRWPSSDNSCPGTAGDPLLAPLGNYGGPTRTLALLPGSAAIEAGNDGNCQDVDQRGIPRPQLSHCDSGAFESRGFTVLAYQGSKQSARCNTAFQYPLSVYVFSLYSEPVEGGTISFTGPKTGAGIKPQANVAVTDGTATCRVSANTLCGKYRVAAGASGVESPFLFVLTNTLY